MGRHTTRGFHALRGPLGALDTDTATIKYLYLDTNTATGGILMIDLFGVIAGWAGRLFGLYLAYRVLKYVFGKKGRKREDEE